MGSKGRPSNKLLNKYNYDNSGIDILGDYYSSNMVTEDGDKGSKEEPVQVGGNREESKPDAASDRIVKVDGGSGDVPATSELIQKSEQGVVIKIDKEKLIKADAVISAILEGGLNFIGVKKEINALSVSEAELMLEVMPPLYIKKNWTNFAIAYFLIKILK